jgi:hypothetical protein
MKNIISALLLSFVSIVCFGQAPSKINYQAIARDGSGVILANQSINASVKILALTTTGAVVYHETHSVSTNEFGLFYFKIGEGAPIIGTSLADVNWKTGPNFLSVNVNGDDLGTTELVSVPYALHSASAGGINGVNITTNAPANGDILSYNSTSLQWELVPGGSNTDDQVVQNFTVNSADSTITLELETGGGPQIIDLRPYLSSGTDDQNIESLGLTGTTLTVGIENGSAQTVDLSSLQDGVADADSVIGNEYNTNFGLNGTLDSLIVQDAGGQYAVAVADINITSVSSVITDADGDTEINLESVADEDIIHFSLGDNAGYPTAEYFRMIGPRLEYLNSGGSVFLGEGAGASDNLAGNINTFIGNYAGTNTTAGTSNVGIGANSLLSNTTGSANIAVGESALQTNTIGFQNVGIGWLSLNSNLNGNHNTAAGWRSLASNTDGDENTASGYSALLSNTSGSSNVAVGTQASYLSISGNDITAVGSNTGVINTTGNNNTFIGSNADASPGMTNLNNATAIGFNSKVGADNSLVLGENANIGIGTSTPNNKLEVVGDAAKFDSVIIVNGANTGYVLTSDAAGNASWQTPSTPAVFWSGSAGIVYPTTLTDNVGIGTTTPVSELDVMGNARLNDGKLMLGPVGGVNSGYTGVYEDGGDLKLAVFAGGAPATNFGTNTIDALTVLSNSAYVGIGTTNPLANLNVVGADPGHMARFENSNNAGSSSMIFADDAASEQLYIGFANTGYSSPWNGHGYLNTTQDFVFAKNNVERMRLGAGGFGIGTNAPDATLDVVGNFQLDDGTQAAGYVLTSDAAGNASWQSSGGVESIIQDLDGNTFVETDALSNGTGDVIDFNLGGVNHFRMNGPTLETFNTSSSVFIGEGAGLNDDLTGNQGVFIGYGAGGSNTTGQSNVGLGMLALGNNTSGGANTAVGGSTLNANVTGFGNTAIGFSSQQSSNGTQNTSVGNGAMNANTSGSDNVVVGVFALSTNTTGSSNTAIGRSALEYANGTNANVAVGAFSQSQTTSGDQNVSVGKSSLAANTTGTRNASLGYTSLSQNTTGANNTGIGQEALLNNLTGSNNTALGAYSGVSINGLTNTTAIGSNVLVSQSNSVVIGNSANVGIGTTAPSAKLDVVGSVKITDGTEGLGRELVSDATGNTSWKIRKVGFHAGTNAVTGQNVLGGTLTNISMGAGINYFNDGAGYNTSTSQFTPPVNGVYQMNCHISYTGGTPGAVLQLFIKTPGGWVARFVGAVDQTGAGVVSVSAAVSSAVTSGPYSVQMFSSGSFTIDAYDSHFSGVLIYAD